MATARTSVRVKEIGVKKVLGAAKWQLMIQLLGESCIAAFLALVIALGLVELIIALFLITFSPSSMALTFVLSKHNVLLVTSCAVLTSQAISEAGSVYGRNRRLEQLEPALERVDGRFLPERAGKGACGTAVLDVGAGTECLAGTGENGDPGVLVVAEAEPRGVQRLAHPAVDRIATPGPVVRDGDDMPVLVIEYCVRHNDLPFFS